MRSCNNSYQPSRMPTRALCIALIALATSALSVPAARADIFAVTQVAAPSPRDDSDLALVDASTGAFLTLPAGINTGDFELHPSVTPDGTRLVFKRASPTAPNQIIMADLLTGTTAELFNGFDAAASTPSSPGITPDGKTVLTGGPFRTTSSGTTVAVVTLTDVSGFPAGPFPRSTFEVPFPDDDPANGFVDHPVATGSAAGSLIAFRVRRTGLPTGIQYGQIGGSTRELAGIVENYGHPAIGSPEGSSTLLFDEHRGGNGTPVDTSDIGFLVFDSCCATLLPPSVNTPLDETRPAFTPDGRYVGFIRTGTDGRDRLLVWDSQTQTLVNGTGVDLGPASHPDRGSLSLYYQSILRVTRVSSTGTISFNLLQASGVGILVQRVVGHHNLFGRRVPTLTRIGRVPFGKFARGGGHAHWNLKVNGRSLAPGTYQVTVRALTPRGRIRDLGTPQIIRVRR